MTPQRLTQMANQIGSYFAAYPDPDQARAEIANHLAKFWSPDMRRGLLEQLDRHGQGELLGLVAESIREHRQRLQPR